jgi:hypothetical protein
MSLENEPRKELPEVLKKRRLDKIHINLFSRSNPESQRKPFEQTRKTFEKLVERTGETASKGVDLAKKVPDITDQFLIKSRESRLILENESKQLNPIQRFFRQGPLGLLAKTVTEAIPSTAFGYGVGDVVTGISALAGKDILDGKKLDIVDRVLYGIATLIPFVPATILVIPMHAIRSFLEDAHHAYKTGKKDEAIIKSQELFKSAKELREVMINKKK